MQALSTQDGGKLSITLLRRSTCSTLVWSTGALQVGKGKIVKVSGIQDKGKTATVLLRGSNKLVLEEAERSLHDALCVIRCLVHKRALIAGGAAPEVEMTTQLSKWAKELQVGMRLVLRSSGCEAVKPAPVIERPGPHTWDCASIPCSLTSQHQSAACAALYQSLI